MGYEIHIERQDSGGQNIPITLEEWRAIVEGTDGIRLAEGRHNVTNPKTGEVISFGNAGGDAEVFLPDASTWRRAFLWSRPGRISFRAPSDWDEPTSQIRRIATALARSLGATLVGDEGEVYE